MSLDYVPIKVVRKVSVVTATFGVAPQLESEIAGSPFLARVYRVPQTTVTRDEAQPGTATLDEMQRLSILDPACPIQINDIAYLPLASGLTQRAKIVRPRYYSDRVQFDLETGAEGNVASGNGALGPALPPTLSFQSQIDALSAQLGALEMSFSNFVPSGIEPIIALTAATVSPALPTTNTVYKVTPVANQIITLPLSTGTGVLLHFDFQAMGGFTSGFALSGSDAYAGGAATAATIAAEIQAGTSISLRSVAPGVYQVE